jgi:hypothetical protein
LSGLQMLSSAFVNLGEAAILVRETAGPALDFRSRSCD